MEIAIDSGGVNLGLLLFNVLLQVTVISSLALAIAGLLKNKPAKRYAVLFTTLLSLGLITPVSIMTHLNGLSVLPKTPASLSSADHALSFEPLSLGWLNGVGLGDDLGIFSAPEMTSNRAEESVRDKAGIGSLLARVLLGLWIAGFLFAMIRLLKAHTQLGTLIDNGRLPDRGERQRLEPILKSLRNGRLDVDIRLIKHLSGPALTGIRHPMVLLPDTLLTSLTDDQLASVLTHEIAHLQRNDVVASYCQRLLCSLYWFHPAVRMMDKLINRTREEICDNYVLAVCDPVSYSEVLLALSYSSRLSGSVGSAMTGIHARYSNSVGSPLALGMFDENWTLEDRVRGLISENRERVIMLSIKRLWVMQGGIVSFSMLLAACQFTGAQGGNSGLITHEKELPPKMIHVDPEADEVQEPVFMSVQSGSSSRRNAPEARLTQVLSDEVAQMVDEIQTLLSPEDDSEEPDMEAAKTLLDQLTIERYELLNDFEKQVSLNFLVNYHLYLQQYREAAEVFERIMTIENLRSDMALRTLRSLGQLYASFEEWETSNERFQQWRELTEREDQLVYRSLSYNYYQLEQWLDAKEYWESYLTLIESEDQQPERDDLAYLNGLYLAMDELNKALDLTKEMILLFNEQKDWDNLRAIYSMLDAKDQVDASVNEVLGQLSESVREPRLSDVSAILETGDYLPLVAIAPRYPSLAANEGIEGWVLVSFTVLQSGLVDEDSIIVLDAEPASIFDKNSVSAAKKFEFLPRVLEGEAVPVEGVQYLFRYKLEQEV